MSNTKVAPTIEERPRIGGGTERKITHPSFATVQVTRVNGADSSLFDSNIKHNSHIRISFHEAHKTEDAYSQHIFASGKTLFEVAVTENQFVSLITRMNMGSGTPCTLQVKQSGPLEFIPGIATFEDSAAKLGRKATEIYDSAVAASKEDADNLRAVIAALPKKKQEEALRLIDRLTTMSATNMDYGKTVLTETSEKLVTEAKVELNSMVNGIVTQLGVNSLQELTRLAAITHNPD